MNDETRAAEPLLVSGMRRHPTGDVRHVPAPPTGACGTSTAGFLRELDEWAAAIRAEALREAADAALSMYDPPSAECVEWADWLRARADRITASPAPTEKDDRYPAGHGFTPSTSPFSKGDCCRVMLARYPCDYPREQHDPDLPPVDVDVFGYRRAASPAPTPDPAA